MKGKELPTNVPPRIEDLLEQAREEERKIIDLDLYEKAKAHCKAERDKELVEWVKDLSDSREHVTNDHYSGYEQAIDEIINHIQSK